MGLRPCKQLRNTPEKAANCKSLACEHFQSCLDRAGKASPSVIRTCEEPNGGCPDEGAGVKSPAKVPVPETGKGLNGNCFPLPVGNFGIISLFDGVSSVVPALCQKLQQAPAVAVLAEMDPALRELVSFEFGYCLQERWKRPFAGFPAIHVKDVRRIFEKRLLDPFASPSNCSHGQVVHHWRFSLPRLDLCWSFPWPARAHWPCGFLSCLKLHVLGVMALDATPFYGGP